MALKPQVVVTGVGLALPLGLAVGAVLERSLRGESAITPLSLFDVSGHPCTASAEVRHAELSVTLRVPKNRKFMGRGVLTAVHAAKQAVAQSALDLDRHEAHRLALHVGSGETGLETSEFFRALTAVSTGREEEDYRRLGGRASRLIDPYFSLRTLSNAGTALLSTELGARGASSNFVHGDTASALAIGAAVHDLVEGRCDIAIAGGFDSLVNVSTYLAYEGAGLLSASPPDVAYRPFDRDGDGLVLGEGAAFLVLERIADAEGRGARVLGQLVGVGSGTDPADSMEPKASAAPVRAALEEALHGGRPDFVVAHGIGTPQADRREAELLRGIFGATTPITAFKSQTGYLGAATAATELALALLAARARRIPPIARHAAADADIGLDLVVGDSRNIPVETPTALCIAWSWSGQSTALVARAVGA